MISLTKAQERLLIHRRTFLQSQFFRTLADPISRLYLPFGVIVIMRQMLVEIDLGSRLVLNRSGRKHPPRLAGFSTPMIRSRIIMKDDTNPLLNKENSSIV